MLRSRLLPALALLGALVALPAHAAPVAPPAVGAALQQLMAELDRSESLRISRLPAGDALVFRLGSERRALSELAQAPAPAQAWLLAARRSGSAVTGAWAAALPLAPLRTLLEGPVKSPGLSRASYELDLSSPRAQALLRPLLAWLPGGAAPAGTDLVKLLEQHPGVELLALTTGSGAAARWSRLWLVPDSVQLDIRNSPAPTAPAASTGAGAGAGAASAAGATSASPGNPGITVTPDADGGSTVTFEIDPGMAGPPPGSR